MSEEDLKKFINEHFVYEVDMLYYAATKLLDLNKSASSSINEINLTLEAVVIHGRNLVEFFYYDNDDKNYARAFHFINKSEWSKQRPAITNPISELRNRSSVEMAHLTYNRIEGTPPEKNWDWVPIVRDLLIASNIFLYLLPNMYIDSNIEGLKRKIVKY